MLKVLVRFFDSLCKTVKMIPSALISNFIIVLKIMAYISLKKVVSKLP